MATDQQNQSLYARIFGDTDSLNKAAQADPRIQRAIQARQPGSFTIRNPGDGSEWSIDVTADGRVTAKRGSVVKPLIAAAAVFTGGVAAAGMLPGVAGLGVGAPAAPAPASTIRTGAGPVSSLPSLVTPAGAAVTGPGVVSPSTGFSLSSLLGKAAPSLINAGTNIYATHAQTSANSKAAELERQTAQEALAYTKERDEQQRKDMLDAQNKNYALYQQAQQRIDPYRRFGLRSLDQLSQPIPGVGSLGARMGGV